MEMEMEMEMEMIKFETDVCFEDENFEETLERLNAAVPTAYVRVLRANGSGGGWPTIEVLIPKSDVRKFADWYSKDEAEFLAEEWISEAAAL